MNNKSNIVVRIVKQLDYSYLVVEQYHKNDIKNLTGKDYLWAEDLAKFQRLGVQFKEVKETRYTIRNSLGYSVGDISIYDDENVIDPMAIYAIKVNVPSEKLISIGYRAVKV